MAYTDHQGGWTLTFLRLQHRSWLHAWGPAKDSHIPFCFGSFWSELAHRLCCRVESPLFWMLFFPSLPQALGRRMEVTIGQGTEMYLPTAHCPESLSPALINTTQTEPCLCTWTVQVFPLIQEEGLGRSHREACGCGFLQHVDGPSYLGFQGLVWVWHTASSQCLKEATRH